MNFFIYILLVSSIFETSFFLFLLKLESMMMLIYFISQFFFSSGNMLISILIMAVIEGCLGLICLVLKVRSQGKDMIMV